MKTATLIDLFCGAGGFSRGFWLEGFKILLGLDSFPPVARSFKANFPEATVLVEDIKEVSSELISRIVGDVDVVIGGPPCLPRGTKVFLRRGIVNIEEVRVGDSTYTHKGLESRVKRVTCRDYSGELVRIMVDGFDREILLTPEHPVYTVSKPGSKKWVEASKVKAGDYIALAPPRRYDLRVILSVSNVKFRSLLKEAERRGNLRVLDGYVKVVEGKGSESLKFLASRKPLETDCEDEAIVSWLFQLSLGIPSSLVIDEGSRKRTYRVEVGCGDILVEDSIAMLRVKRVSRLLPKHPIQVYNLEVESHESYLAPPLTVHNCEPFTSANPNRMRDPYDRLYSDPTGRLVLEFIRVVGDLKPKIFVMENVPQIMDHPLPKFLRREFSRIGYDKVFFNILKAEDYGNPSHRIRVFISNIKINPEPLKERVTVDDVLRELPPPGYGFMPNHEPTPISKRKLERIKKLRWGQPLIYYKGARGQDLPNYIRLHPKRIAPTVLGSSRFIHPFEDRFLTVREQARLMGYPDYHVFYGGRDVQYEQVGESVPVPLARVIAREVLRNLE